MAIDPRALEQAIDRFRKGVDEVSLTAALEQVCAAAVDLFGVSGAGLMIVDDNQSLRCVVATDDAGTVLEKTQEQVGEGPCVDSLILDILVMTADVTSDERWPRLGPLMRETRVRSVLGVPARAGGGAIGAFNVYRSTPGEWSVVEIQAVTAFNTVVESLIGSALLADAHESVVQQLQYALENRVNIERAVGVIMGREGVDPVTAFNRLRAGARSQRRKVADLAQEILQGFTPPA